MKPHTKLYMDYFRYDENSYIPCEICGAKSVDIHHIVPRGMGGTNKPDTIENLMALCREHHIQFGDKKQFKEYLRITHLGFLK